jgi:ribosomal protein S18 acetylase RimI-like enzyme
MVTLVAEHGRELIGFAQLRWRKTPGFVPGTAPGEIQRLYIASIWHGKGIAQALVAACMEEMKARGSDAVWLGVWERNPRAIAFYRNWDFPKVESTLFSWAKTRNVTL